MFLKLNISALDSMLVLFSVFPGNDMQILKVKTELTYMCSCSEFSCTKQIFGITNHNAQFIVWLYACRCQMGMFQEAILLGKSFILVYMLLLSE